MAPTRSVVIAGAGIGGLTAALALAQRGFRAVVLEQAERLQETGAGIQLTPNATRVLIGLGLRERLAPHVVAPRAIRVRHGRSGGDIVRIPLQGAEARYGTPYWIVHRGDLQAVLAAAAHAHPDIVLKLGQRVEDFAVHQGGVTVETRRTGEALDERGMVLIGADGLWSQVRKRLGDDVPPRLAGRTAWRALVGAEAVDADLNTDEVQLWLGRSSHLVHYPIKGGAKVNIVAIARDRWGAPGYSAPADSDDVLSRFSRGWAAPARTLLQTPTQWLKWALADRPPRRRWGRGPATLLGDAAHPMLPFLAQGGAMAIEDAAVLAAALAEMPQDPERALRRYEAQRRARAARVQRAARRNGDTYHLGGLAALARNTVIRALGGERLLAGYDWIYDWRQR